MKRYYNKLMVVSIIAIVLFTLNSCASKPKFTGTGDLCGLVIDENNQPVSDFVLYCKKDSGLSKSAITNESGLFVIQGVPAGIYKISGEKSNYSKITDFEYQFVKRSNILCLQIMSLKGAISEVDGLILRGEKEKAILLLNNISVKEKSSEEALINSYKYFLVSDEQSKNQILAQLKNIDNSHSKFFTEYSDLLEAKK